MAALSRAAGVAQLGLLLACLLAASWPSALAQTRQPGRITECLDPGVGSLLDFGRTCDSACRSTTYQALGSLYDMLGPPSGNTDWAMDLDEEWGRCDPCYVSNQTLEVATFNRTAAASDQRLPSYCCWLGVVCCGEFHALEPSSNLYLAALAAITSSPTLSGALKAAATAYLKALQTPTCSKYGVTGLEFSQFGLNATFSDTLPDLKTLHDFGLTTVEWQTNELVGSLPEELGQLSNLTVLNLGNNNLTGTVPEALGGMDNLTELNLEFNFLRGSLSGRLCRDANKLQALWMRGNNFEGSLDLSNCVQLRLVDLQDNNFTGSLPVTTSNSQLNILRVRNNEFSGPFPEAIYYLRYLGILDMTNNSFSGNLSSKISNNEYMLNLYLGNNTLTGTLPEELTYLTSITRLDLSQNNFSGTLPDMGGLLGLQEFTAAGNNLVGTIPDSLGNLPYLISVDLSYTLMSCCNTSNAPHSYDEAVATLHSSTPFLQFGGLSGPPVNVSGVVWTADAGIDYSYGNLRCFPVGRNSSNPPHTKVLNPGDLSAQTWILGPEYWWFQNCMCDSGFDIQWRSTSSAFVSCPVDDSAGACMAGFQYPVCVPSSTLMRTILTATLVPVLVILMSVISYFICCRRVTKIYRTFFTVMKRYKGMPRRGLVSIVVTDIEGYSDLMKQHPDLMLKALTLHNNVIRKAKFTNIGYTLEQEGDSYLLAFHEPYDAVSFCIQAQQALMKVDWPKGLPGVSMTNKKSNSGKQKRQGNGDAGTSAFFSIRDNSRKRAKHTSFKQDVEGSAVLQGVEEQAGSGSSNPAMEDTASSRPSHNRLVDWLRVGSAGAGERQLFRGLRVRMGVATGDIREGQELRNSAVFEQAKVVSDAANGGQILMDAPSFIGIKDSLHQLGATDANGLNYRKLTTKKTIADRLCFRAPVEQDEALVLDMGEYHLSTEQQRQGRQHSQQEGQQPMGPSSPQPSPRPQLLRTAPPYACGVEEEVAEPGTPASSQRGGLDVLRIYQILAPALVRRAKVFGNRLALREDATCSDMPYFDAPGAKEAHLTSSRNPLDMITQFAHSELGIPQPGAHTAAATAAGAPSPAALSPAGTYGPSMLPPPGLVPLLQGPQQIPDITMVFATVENYKSFFKRKNVHSTSMQRILSALVKEALRHVRGGYLCRQQENPPKFMVAFSTPQAALEWCLMVQEASMYVRWPLGVLLHKAFKEEYNAQGRLVFRGPRLKMGICEGCPNTIMPDHLGRADYHGASINQAARYMDAAAHGGQVVCELQLANKVMEAWASSSNDATEQEAADASKAAGSRLSSTDEEALMVPRPSQTDHVSMSDAADLQSASVSRMDSMDAGGAIGLSREPSLAGSKFRPAATAAAAAAAAAARTPSPEASSSSASVAAGPAFGNGSLPAIATRPSAATPFAGATQNGDGGTPHTQSTGTYTLSMHSASFSSAVGTPPHTAATMQASLPHSDSSPMLSVHGSASKRSGKRRPLSHLFRRGTSSHTDSDVSGAGQSTQFPASIVAAMNELLHGHTAPASLPTAKSIPEEDGNADGAAGNMPHAANCPQYSLPSIPTSPTRVEVHWSGVYRFKGNATPLDMVHVCTAALASRTFPADPPKGKGHRLEERMGLVVAAEVPLPTLASEYLASFPAALLWRAPRAAAAVAVAAASLRTSSMPSAKRRSASETGGVTASRSSSSSGGGADGNAGGGAGAGTVVGAKRSGGLGALRSLSSTTAAAYASMRPPLSRLGNQRPPELQLQSLQRQQSTPQQQQQQQQQQQGQGPLRSVQFATPAEVARTASAPMLEISTAPAQPDGGSHSVTIVDGAGDMSPVRPATPSSKGGAGADSMV